MEIVQNPQHNRGGELPIDLPTAVSVINWWWGRFGRHDAERAKKSREKARRTLAEARYLKARLADWALSHITPNETGASAVDAVNAVRQQTITIAAVSPSKPFAPPQQTLVSPNSKLQP